MNMATVKKDPVLFVRELQDDLSRAFCRTFMNHRRWNLYGTETQDMSPANKGEKEDL